MGKRGRILMMGGVLTAALMLVAGVDLGAQGTVPELSGVWKLNVAASTNPDGPPAQVSQAPPRSGGGRSGGGGGGGGGGGEEGGASSVVRSAEGGALGKEEMSRFNAIKAMFFKAPAIMALDATATDFKMLLDPEKKLGFLHKTDNKKQSLVTPAGPADFKVKWDGKKIRREVETKDTFHLVEEYSLSPDGRQLIVTLKADSRMVRSVQTADIIRVYDRQPR